MHFKAAATRLGGLESQVDGAAFFMSPAGKSDPAAEWRADSAALRAPVVGDGSFACRFPARAAWMRARDAGAFGGASPSCPAFESFRDRIAADSVSLVFASSYVNSPPSAFGHVYLKLRKKAPAGGPPTAGLTDHTVAFGALMEGAGPVKVIWGGFTGGFQGHYNVMSFDANLRKYAYLDQRDQWVFPLTLDSTEVARLVAHLWELRQTYIDYYFLTENCAHHLASLLAASDLNADLEDAWFPTPLHLARRAVETGLAGAPTYLPSSRSELARRIHDLSPSEFKALRAMIDHGYDPDRAAALPDTAEARVLDAAEEHMDYALATRWIFDSTLHDRRLKAAAIRSELPAVTAPSAPSGNSPSASHRTPRLEAGYRRGDGRTGLALRFEPALHALTDAPEGIGNTFDFRVLALDFFVPFTAAGMSDPNARFVPEFERFTLFRIFNFNPSSPLLRGTAWSTQLAFDRAGSGPLDVDFDAGAGKSFATSPDNRQVAYGLVTGGARWIFEEARGDAFAGLRAGLVVTPASRLRATLEADGRVYAHAGPWLGMNAKGQYNITPGFGLSQEVFRRPGNDPGDWVWQSSAVFHF